MKFLNLLLFLGSLSVCVGFVTPNQPAANKAGASKGTASNKKTATKTAPVKRTAKGAARPATSTYRSRQTVPSPERYKEIQAALASRGYLKSEPDGKWNAGSSDALKQFQEDHQMQPTGKLTSASLIGLGLGGKSASEPIGAPLPSKGAGVPVAEPPRVESVPPSQP
jgi:hypothetical protein